MDRKSLFFFIYLFIYLFIYKGTSGLACKEANSNRFLQNKTKQTNKQRESIQDYIED